MATRTCEGHKEMAIPFDSSNEDEAESLDEDWEAVALSPNEDNEEPVTTLDKRDEQAETSHEESREGVGSSWVFTGTEALPATDRDGGEYRCGRPGAGKEGEWCGEEERLSVTDVAGGEGAIT